MTGWESQADLNPKFAIFIEKSTFFGGVQILAYDHTIYVEKLERGLPVIRRWVLLADTAQRWGNRFLVIFPVEAHLVWEGSKFNV